MVVKDDGFTRQDVTLSRADNGLLYPAAGVDAGLPRDLAVTTKDMTGQIQGIDNLQQLLTLMPAKPKQAIPVVAIGGINFERAPEVLATGVDSIAVVTAITKASNPEQAATKLANLTTLY